ncbi:MAG: hypothetical protein ACK47G_08440, partial [Pseudanabaena sp.]
KLDYQTRAKSARYADAFNHLYSTPLIKILEYAKEKDCFITASQVKSGIRLFRDSPVSEIRSYFQWLADRQSGIVRGEADTLEFSAQ